MKNSIKKRFLGLILSSTLVLSTAVTGFAAVEFSDLENSPYRTAVNSLAELNIINGYEDGTFKPENNITRAEACVIISKAMNPGEKKYSAAWNNSFSDVNDGYDWAKKYINYASAMKAVDGYTDGSFKPGNNVTYNELAAMILKGMGYFAENLKGSWPDNFKNKAIEIGIYDDIYELLSSDEKEAFNYNGTAVRGNAALMINKALEGLQERGKEELPENQGAEYDWISGESVNLTLDSAVDIMQNTGYLAEIAKNNYESDVAIAKGYSDNIKDIKDAIKSLKKLQSSQSEIEDNQDKVEDGIKQIQDMIDLIGDTEDPTAIAQKEALQASLLEQQGLAQTLASSLAQVETALDSMPEKSTLETNKKMAELQQSFAEENAEKNHQAELNSIEYQTVSLYYGVIQASENVKACEENLSVQEKLLKETEAKYSVGAVSKISVTSQQSAVNTAKQNIIEAKASLEKAKMSFNMLLGFDIRNNVELTDELIPITFPDITISKAVENAMENRLSVVQLDYACEIQELSKELLKKTDGKSSGAYLKQVSALEITRLAYENMPETLENEIRSAYIDMKNKYDAIAESKETKALADEGLRTAQVLYKAGMGTASAVEKAQLSANQAKQLILANIASYNLSVYEFEYMTGVGKERIDL